MCALNTVKNKKGTIGGGNLGKNKRQMCVGVSVKCNVKCTFQSQNNQIKFQNPYELKL